MTKVIKTSVALFAVFFLCYAFIAYGRDVSAAVVSSINSCLTVIIPSLFGFLVLAGLLIKTGLYALISKPFCLISRYVFKIPEQYFSIFLISLFAGYPVGAKLLYELRASDVISKKEASDILCCSYTSGPAFIIGLVGAKLFGGARVGLVIYLSVVLANLILAAALGFFKKVPPKSQGKASLSITAKALVDSVESGAKSLFQVCIMIVFFAALIAVLKEFFTISPLIASFLEISNLSALPLECYSYLPQISAAFSFGGVCVILQIAAIVRGEIPLWKFVIVRIISAPLSAFLCSGLNFLIGDISVLASITSQPSAMTSQTSPVASICLIIMTVMLLLIKRKRTL